TKISRAAGFDQNIGLAGEAVGLNEWAGAMHQRQPIHRAIGVVFGDRQGAFIKDVAVGAAVGEIDAFAGDEAIDIFKAFVVAGIDDIAAILVDDAGGSFM